jgi:16S rRNA (guanine527-N7)-methyltransferase
MLDGEAVATEPERLANWTETVVAAARRFGRPISREAGTGVARYCELLLRWNERINLTGARTLDELLREHLPDSFALAALVGAQARVIDVGSGGGLPAVPFSLLRPDAAVTLVEPRAKRVAFLRTAVRELGLACTVVAGRVDTVKDRFDVASSRATFPPAEWLQEGSRLVVPGGHVLFLVHETAELPFPLAEPHQLLRYRAGEQDRVAAALVQAPR